VQARGRCNRAHQPDACVLTASPIIDVRVVSDRGCNDFSVRRGHALGHRAPHSAQGFGRSRLGEIFCGPLDIGPRDGVVRPCGLYSIEIDVKLVCEGAYRWERLTHSSKRRLGECLRGRGLLLAGVELANHGAGILLGTLSEFDQGSAYLQQITFGAEHAHNATAVWRWHLDHGLVGLDRDERLIRNHMVALVYMPGYNFRLFEAFTEIRQHELSHGVYPADFN